MSYTFNANANFSRWCNKTIDKCKDLHNKESTTHTFMHCPIAHGEQQKCQIIQYWRRILKMSQNAYVSKAYKSLYELDDLEQTNWYSFVKDILNEVQLQQCWDSQTMNDK